VLPFIKSIQPTVPDASLAVEQHREPSDSADCLAFDRRLGWAQLSLRARDRGV